MSDYGADRRDDWHGAQQHGDPRRGYDPQDRYDYGRDQRIPEPRESEARYASLADLSHQREERQSDWVGGGGGGDYGRQHHLSELPRGPRSGEPLPPMQRPTSGQPVSPPPMSPPPFEDRQFDQGPAYPREHEALREPTGMVDAAAVRRSVAESDGIYRSKRPAMMALFGVFAALGELFCLIWMVKAGGMLVAPFLAAAGIPMVALGLYAVTTGAATAVQFQGPRVWLRTPLVYLPIGLALLIAAL